MVVMETNNPKMPNRVSAKKQPNRSQEHLNGPNDAANYTIGPITIVKGPEN